MALNVSQKVPVLYLQHGEYEKVAGVYHLIQLTILVIYNRLCSLLYTTDFLKNCSLACISPSYNENTEMGTFVSLLEHHYMFWICICYE